MCKNSIPHARIKRASEKSLAVISCVCMYLRTWNNGDSKVNGLQKKILIDKGKPRVNKEATTVWIYFRTYKLENGMNGHVNDVKACWKKCQKIEFKNFITDGIVERYGIKSLGKVSDQKMSQIYYFLMKCEVWKATIHK